MSEDLLEVVKDGVAVLTMNRPDRLNALSGPMLEAMLEALPRLAESAEAAVVVLTGAGRAFCAGGDVKAMAEGREFGGTTLEEKAPALRSRMEVSRWLHEMPLARRRYRRAADRRGRALANTFTKAWLAPSARGGRRPGAWAPARSSAGRGRSACRCRTAWGAR
jgi:enoyl-CoA hydratase/carnithine racemase